MTTFAMPLNARVTSEAVSSESLPLTGYVPVVIPFVVSKGMLTGTAGASSGSMPLFSLPSNYCLDDVRFSSRTLWGGASVGTVHIRVGVNGLEDQTHINFVSAKTDYSSNYAQLSGYDIGRAPGYSGLQYGWSVSVSGTAAQGCSLGSLTAGDSVILITVGVPYEHSTRS